jgi:hypothetical protein
MSSRSVGMLGWQLNSFEGSCPHPWPFSRGEKGADLHAERAGDCGWAIAFGKFCYSPTYQTHLVLIASCSPLPWGEGLGVRE